MSHRFRPFLLSILLAAAACAPPKDSGWGEIKTWVAESFPDVPRTTVEELQRRLDEGQGPILLDARAPEEFEVSHLAGALLAPDQAAALQVLEGIQKNTPIVVYCSVGYRSGDLATKLQSLGFTAVENLEGSIFEWANEGLPLEANETEAELVHPYDEEWGRLLDEQRRAPID